MFDIGGLELLMVAAIALIVVGPKELPGMVRNVGRWVSRARQMAREFQQGMEDAAKEADIDELRQIGSIKSDLERQARDFGRSAQTVLDDAETDRPARRAAPSAPRAPERRAPEERVEPDFDAEDPDRAPRGSGYADRAPSARREPVRDAGRASEPNDALERFQRGMRGGE